MTYLNILDNIELERKRRLLSLLGPDQHAFMLWSRALASLPDKKERARLTNAFSFAKEIKYHHGGLESNVYFLHPLRVAALAILISGTQDAEIGIVGILHNVLEVSDLSLNELRNTFGSRISNQIDVLTVDRNLQWDKVYKEHYYKKIINSHVSTHIVKILDKLDNLFLLGLNPDASLRERYLAEIENFILPMTMTSQPNLIHYIQDLVDNCRETGFINLPASIN